MYLDTPSLQVPNLPRQQLHTNGFLIHTIYSIIQSLYSLASDNSFAI